MWILLWGVLVLLCGRGAAGQSSTHAASTRDIYEAFSNPQITSIIINDSVVLDGAHWPNTVNVSRNVTVSPTPERLARGQYVLFDWNNLPMLIWLAPGVLLKLVGFETYQHAEAVGGNVRFLRQTQGAAVLFQDGIVRRRAGLPLEAAVVNQRAAPRPVLFPGTQNVSLVRNFTFNTTRSPVPITMPAAVAMTDFAMDVAQDSSLAFQMLFYGGYAYATLRSFYIIDNIVDQSCLNERSGVDCVALLIKKLDEQDHAPPPAEAAPSSGGDSVPLSTIIPAVVVPTVVVLAALAGLGWFLAVKRGRRSSGSSYGGAATGDLETGKGSRAAPAAGASNDGIVFLGLDDDNDDNDPQLPDWLPVGPQADEDVDEIGRPSLTAGHPHHTLPPGSELGIIIGPHGAHGGTGSGTAPLMSRMLRPALSTYDDAASGGGTLGTLGEEGNGGPDTPGPVRVIPPAGLMAAAGGGAGGDEHAGTGTGGPATTSTNSNNLGLGPDVQAELAQMAAELRSSVRDSAIRLDAVIGCGSYGTVYRGTWQGLSVAVKTVVFSASQERRRRALQEAALCQSISHPNIIATYCSDLQPIGTLGTAPTSGSGGRLGTDPTSQQQAADGSPFANNSHGATGDSNNLSRILDWRLYIVMEYADGGPLRCLYGNKSLWPGPEQVNLPAVVALALGIARALSHLHSKRIVHADLNPNNVLLKRDPKEPSGYAVKVSDFGLSVMLPQHRSHLSNVRMGTMFYVCPAVVMKAQVGPPSDVFSLGVMLWELYHGRAAGTRTADGPRYCSIFPAFPPSCPEPYKSTALRCLRRTPAKRITATAVEAQLERLLASLLQPKSRGSTSSNSGPVGWSGPAAPGPSSTGGGSATRAGAGGSGTGPSSVTGPSSARGAGVGPALSSGKGGGGGGGGGSGATAVGGSGATGGGGSGAAGGGGSGATGAVAYGNGSGPLTP
ncbi:hypothetical protein HYH03_005664 [Edaphochlamys debaryana]|uniref:Protein kinase domain-containing protein n=1 Tax=Edaphochlamys debaryana TaxID=47281 RepID=A0A835Y5C8_9CHLO|nr:hypothetical protein HYH03_005664 [Edaphochlamys debaryana]|eukprot:KAG2496440.1 hypothetical protein HYH03_005664 [Edaphochlamys debaryana]